MILGTITAAVEAGASIIGSISRAIHYKQRQARIRKRTKTIAMSTGVNSYMAMTDRK